MVDKFVGLLADAKANLQAIVRAAKELCRATKGLDPSLNVLVANKVETLSLQEQANVFGNVEKIENNYLSLDGDSATFDLLMNTKMVVEQALTTSAPVSVSLGDPATSGFVEYQDGGWATRRKAPVLSPEERGSQPLFGPIWPGWDLGEEAINCRCLLHQTERDAERLLRRERAL
jgi:hypothetical protein